MKNLKELINAQMKEDKEIAKMFNHEFNEDNEFLYSAQKTMKKNSVLIIDGEMTKIDKDIWLDNCLESQCIDPNENGDLRITNFKTHKETEKAVQFVFNNYKKQCLVWIPKSCIN